MRLRLSGLGGVEHRGENSEPPFHEISSQIGGKQCEVCPITTPRLGEASGPDARNWAAQALAASVPSCQTSVRKPADSIASRVAAAVSRKLVAGVRAHGTG